MQKSKVLVLTSFAALFAVALVGCREHPESLDSGPHHADAAPGTPDGGTHTPDAGTHTPDAGTHTPDAGPSGTDGTPTRVACTNTFGSALSGFGRIDGYLVSIVAPGTSGCNGDSTHLHLQVQMNGSVYDVAVNVDGNFDEADMTIPGGAWSEGWHSASLDYPTIGIHSGAFTSLGLSATAQMVTDELATVNHISVFMTAYTGTDAGSGGHLVHREGSSHDGAIVIRPLSGTAHVLLFDFSTSGTF